MFTLFSVSTVCKCFSVSWSLSSPASTILISLLTQRIRSYIFPSERPSALLCLPDAYRSLCLRPEPARSCTQPHGHTKGPSLQRPPAGPTRRGTDCPAGGAAPPRKPLPQRGLPGPAWGQEAARLAARMAARLAARQGTRAALAAGLLVSTSSNDPAGTSCDVCLRFPVERLLQLGSVCTLLKSGARPSADFFVF